jgi:hypothetical protein
MLPVERRVNTANVAEMQKLPQGRPETNIHVRYGKQRPIVITHPNRPTISRQMPQFTPPSPNHHHKLADALFE